MKKILTSLILVASGLAFAQVGISKDNTDPQATLDVRALGKSDVADGILVPRVEKQKAQDMATNKTANHLQESTLIYITDGDSTVTGTAVADVDAKGFYYFDGTKWVKIGAGSSSSGKTSLNGVTGKAQILPSPVLANQIDDDTFAVIVTGTTGANLSLPNPSNYEGRVLCVNNQSGSILVLTGSYQPANTNSIESGGGFVLMAHKGKWYLIGGLGA